MGAPSICRKAIVKGVVQGVGFRASTAREAGRIGGLNGYVRNLPNGNVEILVQGEPSKVEALLAWARLGPPSATVDELLESHEPADPSLPVFGVKK